MTALDSLENKYHEVMELFHLADELVLTTSHESVRDGDAHMDVIEPLATAMIEAADSLSDAFFVVVEGKALQKKTAKGKIESALRQLYSAIHEYSARAQKAALPSTKLADMVVKKIKRQLEVVVATFLEFVHLSLDKVMQKQDVEELHRHEARIATLLHSYAQGQAT